MTIPLTRPTCPSRPQIRQMHMMIHKLPNQDYEVINGDPDYETNQVTVTHIYPDAVSSFHVVRIIVSSISHRVVDNLGS